MQQIKVKLNYSNKRFSRCNFLIIYAFVFMKKSIKMLNIIAVSICGATSLLFQSISGKVLNIHRYTHMYISVLL